MHNFLISFIYLKFIPKLIKLKRYDDIFRVSIKSQKSELEYIRSFDKDISDYLMKEGIYKEYFLKIIVKSKESLEILNNFLLGITSPKKLRFSKVRYKFHQFILHRIY